MDADPDLFEAFPSDGLARALARLNGPSQVPIDIGAAHQGTQVVTTVLLPPSSAHRAAPRAPVRGRFWPTSPAWPPKWGTAVVRSDRGACAGCVGRVDRAEHLLERALELGGTRPLQRAVDAQRLIWGAAAAADRGTTPVPPRCYATGSPNGFPDTGAPARRRRSVRPQPRRTLGRPLRRPGRGERAGVKTDGTR